MKENALSEENLKLLDEQNESIVCPNTDQQSKKNNCKCTIFKVKMDGGYSWIITFSAFFIHFFLFGFMNNVSLLNIHWMKEFGVEAGNVGILIDNITLTYFFSMGW